MVDDDMFFAWLDGELSRDEAAAVEREVAADPELQRRAAEHRALGARLGGAFGTVLSQPVPERLQWMLRPAGDERVVSLADARARREARPQLPIWKQMAAMAATLAIGVALGNLLTGSMAGSSSSPIEAEAGRLVASAGLENALYGQLASAPAADGPRIGMTFRDRSGQICRTFTDVAASGLACRHGGDWVVRAVFQAPEGSATEYRMAAGADPRLLEIVEESIAGEPFDAAQERAAAERGWR